ncbi:tetratricopeptide repeat protein [Striga asiatica]|uniref:Tetratricopeptide repeat protein n=1 Tax=Striga asiatica TaxID=4170 RepID=A0A5A7PDQ0_STRAF|nr:tetratricopeptide repeat protein [Striga asiatica]
MPEAKWGLEEHNNQSYDLKNDFQPYNGKLYNEGDKRKGSEVDWSELWHEEWFSAAGNKTRGKLSQVPLSLHMVRAADEMFAELVENLGREGTLSAAGSLGDELPIDSSAGALERDGGALIAPVKTKH